MYRYQNPFGAATGWMERVNKGHKYITSVPAVNDVTYDVIRGSELCFVTFYRIIYGNLFFSTFMVSRFVFLS